MKRKVHALARGGIYLAGMVVLAIGISLNALTGLGASSIVAVPFTVSQITGLALGDLTLAWYVLFVAVQLVLAGRQRSWILLLQLPLSVAFTRVMNLVQELLPYRSGFLPADLALLSVAILLTGIGAAVTVDMQLIPNPGDGIVHSISVVTGRELGLRKNLFDFACLALAVAAGASAGQPLVGVGLGTLFSMLGVGRVIALFNARFRCLLQRAAGLIPICGQIKKCT